MGGVNLFAGTGDKQQKAPEDTMTLGAFLDAGLPLAELKAALGSLALGVDISVAKVLRAGVSATQFIVHEHSHVVP